LKLDISKEYDKVNWTFVRLSLIQMGMNLPTFNWIMSCDESSSFAVLINGSPSPLFRSSRGFQKECLLSLFLFLIVVKGLILFIKNPRRTDLLKGITITDSETSSDLPFVHDDILFDVENLQEFQRQIYYVSFL
jgi:hypothetical protein